MEERFGIMHIYLEGGYVRLQGDCYQKDNRVILDGHGFCRAELPLDWCFIEDAEGTLIVHASIPHPLPDA